MRFGYCLDLSHILHEDPIFEAVRAAGFDYIETQLTKLLELPRAQYEQAVARLAGAGLPCRAAMMIFPYSMPLVSEERDLAAIEAHAEKTLAIAADLGCEMLVFGHGGTRRAIDGMDYDIARQRLIDVLRILERLAAPYKLKIAVEPLCDTDMIVSFPEAAALAAQCGGAVGALFDLYHGAALGQSPMDITTAPERVFHLHIACPGGRTVPTEADNQVLYEAFAEAVRITGYDNKLSIEAGVPEGADPMQAIAEGLRVVRKHFG